MLSGQNESIIDHYWLALFSVFALCLVSLLLMLNQIKSLMPIFFFVIGLKICIYSIKTAMLGLGLLLKWLTVLFLS